MRSRLYNRLFCISLLFTCLIFLLSSCSSQATVSSSSIAKPIETFLFSDESWDSSEDSISSKATESKTLEDNETIRYTIPAAKLYETAGTSYYFFKDSKMVRAVFYSKDTTVNDCAVLISEEFNNRDSYTSSNDTKYGLSWTSSNSKVVLYNALGILSLAYYPSDTSELDDNIVESEVSSESVPTAVATKDCDFRSATWGDSLDTVKALETADYLGTSSDDTGTMLLYEGKVAGYSANVIYYFDTEGKLYQGVYDLTESYNQGSIYISVYDTLKDALSSKYGEPSIDEIVSNSHLANNTDAGTALSLGYTLYRTHWDSETYDILIGMSSVNYDTFITIQYLDPQHEEVKNTTGL